MSAGGYLTIDTYDGPMPAYQAVPSAAARGAVVVIQEAFGITTHIEDVARRLADAGWHALAPGLFHREGAPVFAYDDLESVMPALGRLSAAQLETDVAASLAFLAALGHPERRCGIVGFCMGGTVSFHAATRHSLGAAVTFYGGGVTSGRFGYPPQTELASGLRAPWLGVYGDRDRGIAVAEVERLRDAAAAAAVPTEIVRYAEADHGFHCTDRPAVYEPGAAADAWQRTLDWLATHIR
jgi:carboxymethylenebutenolidase